MTPSRDIGRLLEIMAALRTPNTGCPWDLAQNFSTIAPYTLEDRTRLRRPMKWPMPLPVATLPI